LQLAYSNMKEEKTWIVMNNMRRYCSLGNMFELLKYGGNPLKLKFRVTHSVTKYDRAVIAISLQAAENEDQIHSCPMQEKKDVRVLSLAWMKPR